MKTAPSRRFARVNLLIASAVALAFIGRATAQQRRPIRAEVNLVNILAGVFDVTGRPVTDLPAEAFEVYEEGKRQKIEVFEAETALPLDLALMIDSSLSTLKELRFEREAAAHFLRQIVRPGDSAAVFHFSDGVSQLADFSDDVLELQAAVRRIEAGAGTALYDAIVLGAQSLERRERGRRRVIVLMTDAGETTSSSTFEQARRVALDAEALLYTILIRPVKSESGRNTAGEHALVTVTDVTGGAMYYPNEMKDLEGIFDRIDRELRTQYRLGYYPTPRPPAGAFRRVEVRVKLAGAASEQAPIVPGSTRPAGYEVRHRKGYFAGQAEE